VIADLDQKIAVTCGIVHEAVSDTAAVRAVSFIDPKQNIRAILYYPMSCGRNIDELLWVAEALQIADESKCATPANWRPGDPVIAPAPVTQADARSAPQAVTTWKSRTGISAAGG
jgi:peroxiredoxin 2/4